MRLDTTGFKARFADRSGYFLRGFKNKRLLRAEDDFAGAGGESELGAAVSVEFERGGDVEVGDKDFAGP